jgi:hypothetical protein
MVSAGSLPQKSGVIQTDRDVFREIHVQVVANVM